MIVEEYKTVLPLTLLYVEDDEDTRKALGEFFQHKVRKLFVAKDAKEALEIFSREKIHFVISDFQMPGMDGNELCGKIKEQNRNVLFVLLTAYNDTKLLINAIDAGVDKFLQKPIDPTKLLNVMDEVNRTLNRQFELEKSTVCLKEVEKIALLSYWDVNLQTKKIHFSAEAQELFDVEFSENIGYKELAHNVVPEDKEKFFYLFEEGVYNKDRVDDIVAIEKKNGKKLFIHLVSKQWTSSACGTKHVIGMFQDVTRYEVQNRKLIKENQLDPMLHISNKVFVLSELEALIKLSKRYGHSIGVMFFDIDNFKWINDVYGHMIADEILVDLVDLISNNIRQSDIFGRWGGDEFVLVSGYSAPDAILSLKDKILRTIASYEWVQGIELSISVGVAFYEAGDSAETLIERADKKMFECKKANKKARGN